MFWLIGIVGAIVAIFTGVYNLLDGLLYGFNWELVIRPALYLIPTAVSYLGISIVYELDYEESEKSKEYKLVSLQDSSQVNGNMSSSLFYVYASLGTDEVYTYYYELENGGYKRGKVSADDTVIFEEENCTPKLVEYTVYTKNKLGSILRKLFTFSNNPTSEKYEIFVPKGTVLKKFKLDSEQ